MTKKSRFIYGFLITFLLVLNVACSTKPETNKSDKLKSGPQKGIVRIEPSNLFEGENKKIEPHIGLISGCFKIKYTGPKKSFKTVFEVWEEGNLKNTYPGIGMFNDDQVNLNGEISFSFKPNEDNEVNDIKKVLSVYTDRNCTSIFQEKIEFSSIANQTIGLNNTVEISDQEEVYVWAYRNQMDMIRTDYNILNEVKTAKWALAMKIVLSDQ